MISARWTEYQQGRVGLDFYRGRVGYDNPVQAAEHFWREQTGILDLPGMEVVSVEQLDEHEWQIGVQGGRMESDRKSFHILREVSEIEIPMTCSGKKLERSAGLYGVSVEIGCMNALEKSRVIFLLDLSSLEVIMVLQPVSFASPIAG